MKKYIIDNKKKVLNALLLLVALIVALTIVLYIAVNKESEYDSFTSTVVAAIESVKLLDLKDEEYVLVEFPDTKEIIAKNGKLKGSNNKKYTEFTKGYIIIYNDEKYAFKLSNGSYCATKDYNEQSVNIDLYAECEDYTIQMKEA